MAILKKRNSKIDKPSGEAKDGLVNRKIDPRLRLLGNCDFSVCSVRAQTDAALMVQTKPETETTTQRMRSMPLESMAMQKISFETAIADLPDEQDEQHRQARAKGTIYEPTDRALVSVFLTFSGNPNGAGTAVKSSLGRNNIKTAELSLKELSAYAKRPDILSIEIGDQVRVPAVSLSQTNSAKTKPSLTERKVTKFAKHHKYGEDILIGIIDVGGIAFAHEDFLDGAGNTRIERIWDMGGDHRNPPKNFKYGAEFKREDLNKAIVAAKAIGVSPYAIEPQYYQAPGSHATHVASIAAGNHGVCRKAPIACVMMDLPPEDMDRRKSFFDSARIAHAIEYIFSVAEEMGKKKPDRKPLPVAINISLGTNGNAHDGSAAISRWIDYALVEPNRVISVAVGNSGQDDASYPGDLGYLLGRIHTSGQIKNRGLTNTIDWIVAGDGIEDISENEMEIWYEPQDRFSVIVETPSGQKIGPIQPGEFIENFQLKDKTFISIYSELYRPANGCNTISIYLTPWLKEPFKGVMAGKWKVSLKGEDIRDGGYHAWIERDDPRPIRRQSGKIFSRYPSFFSESSNVDSHSVSSLACGERILSVGNYNAMTRRINISSSQGPTRTHRKKPEIIAPGTDIIAANGFGPADKKWIGMSGTSMAAPFATGVAGLMLNARQDGTEISASQIIGIMRRTAKPLENTDFSWKNDNGFGLINPEQCIADAMGINTRMDLTD